MTWAIEYTDEFEAWWDGLEISEQSSIDIAIEALEARGPALGRPFVDSVHGSRHSNMKELRPPGETIRILFAFDPRRTGILLLGGDKRDRWSEWYEENIPVADQLFSDHLSEIAKE